MVGWSVRGMTLAAGSKGLGPWKAVGERVREERVRGCVGEGLKEVGERRKSRDQRFVDDEEGVGEPLERSWTMRLEARGRVEGSGGRRAGSMGGVGGGGWGGGGGGGGGGGAGGGVDGVEGDGGEVEKLAYFFDRECRLVFSELVGVVRGWVVREVAPASVPVCQQPLLSSPGFWRALPVRTLSCLSCVIHRRP